MYGTILFMVPIKFNDNLSWKFEKYGIIFIKLRRNYWETKKRGQENEQA